MSTDQVVLDDPQEILNEADLRGCERDLRRIRDLSPYGAQIHSELLQGNENDYVCRLEIIHKSGVFETVNREKRPRLALHAACMEIESKLKLWKLERQFDGDRAA
jgi:hypothetical protein